MAIRAPRPRRPGARRGRSALSGGLALAAFCLSAIAAIAVGPQGWSAEATAFLDGLEDLPLMPGLVQVPEAGVVFDKPSGRIVEVYAEGPVSRAAVLEFYGTTLPQLGWRPRAETVYRREGEQLELVFLGSDGDLIVRFTVQPQ